VTTLLKAKRVPALRVEPEKTSLCVARRLFGMTKLLSSRLDWRFFRLNSDEYETSTDPSINRLNIKFLLIYHLSMNN
jgi:hypothetical protein